VILTVTLNPALDVTYDVAALRPGTTHRVTAVRGRGGGKGVNVARVLAALGADVYATGLLGGTTGERVRADLDRHAVPHGFTSIPGETRQTLTVVADGDATLFNEPGPPLTAQEWRAFLRRFADLAAAARVVVLSGSLPPGAPQDAYVTLATAARRAHPAKAAPWVLLDTDGPALRAGLAGRPDLVKPNATELATAVRAGDGEPTGDLGAAATELLARGAGGVVVSLGPGGLLAVTGAGAWRARPPGTVRGNPTGAGDAVVAALARALHDRPRTRAGLSELWPRALADAVALSAAAVHAPVAGEIDHDAYARLRTHTTVSRL
jgi:1-phosphofructokinase family hexose kinase